MTREEEAELVARANRGDGDALTTLENETQIDGINTTKAPASPPPTNGPRVTHAPRPSVPDLRSEGPNVDEVWIIARGPSAPAGTDRRRLPVLRAEIDAREVALPLDRTDVHARISGFIATVEVSQRFTNPYDRKIDVEYVFPLPANAAVSDFVMTVGRRRIRGIVRERAEATRLYREARQAGHVVSLLTEERPNVFTQRIANIEPRKRIDVALTYDNLLPWEDGGFTFAFPTVVGPRYNRAGSTRGVGTAPRHAPDSSGQAIEVTYLAPGETSAHRVSFTIELDAGAPLLAVDRRTHPLASKIASDRARTITIARAAPDRDLVLRYRVASGPSLFIHQARDGGSWFALVLPPPAELGEVARSPVEMVFVLDCSGSMHGLPLAAAKRAIEQELGRLRPSGTFQIIRFSDEASGLGPAPVPATPDNVARALEHLASLRSEGGTEMIAGIRAALDFPHDPQRLRVVSFLTDGYIGDEAEILAAIDAKLGPARLFSFGVGTAVNRFLLEKMATFGRGAATFVDLSQTAPEDAARVFYEQISHPALAEVAVDWGTMRVDEVYPRRIPDLVVGRPVIIVGRARGPLPARIRVTGRTAGREIAYDVPVGPAGDHPALAKLWARARLGDLADRIILASEPAALLDEGRRVALAHGLLSPYTAFLAVDASGVTAGEPAPIVPVAVPVPAGVKYEQTVPPR